MARPISSSKVCPFAEPPPEPGLYAFCYTSPQGILEKARWTLGEMERRLAALGFGWSETTATQLYTAHDTWPFLEEELAKRGAMRNGLTWHYPRPPVINLEYEMDARAVYRELVI